MTELTANSVSLPPKHRPCARAESAGRRQSGPERARSWRSIDDVKERNRHDYSRVPPGADKLGCGDTAALLQVRVPGGPPPEPVIFTSSDRFAAASSIKEEEVTIPTASITALLFLDGRGAPDVSPGRNW